MKIRILAKNQIDDVVLRDKLVLDFDISIPQPVDGSVVFGSFNRFPGVEVFRQDVLNILENEFGFEVAEKLEKGKKQKGYVSNRQDSWSVYFDTYLDFSKAASKLDKALLTNLKIPEEGVIYCFIHLRFSDHELNNDGDALHRQFKRENRNKHIEQNPKVTNYVDEEEFIIEPEKLNREYDEALNILRAALESKIIYWIKVTPKYIARKENKD